MVVALTGCSLNGLVADRLGDSLSASGSVYASDDDPELIREAIPFSLKLMESVLAERPEHHDLLVAASRSFTQYAYAFVQEDADEIEERDVAAAYRLRERARKLYRRARDYGLRGLDVAHAGFSKSLKANSVAALATTTKEDVPALYWTGVSWAAMIALSKDSADAVADLPFVRAMVDRSATLDPDFDAGGLQSFLIAFEMARGGRDAEVRAREHFRRAVELSKGRQAGPYVSFAESVAVQTGDRKEFEALLHKALAIDPNVEPESRLVNILMQRRAKWLLDRKDTLFTE